MIRWTSRRKAELLALIDSNPAKGDALIKFHEISPEELIEWRRSLNAWGIKGLRATKTQYYHLERLKHPTTKYTHSKSTKRPKPRQPK